MIGRAQKYARFLKKSKTLYHGSIIDNLDSIRQVGLVPMVGSFVEEAYGDELEDIEVPELTFAADKKTLDKAVTAMMHHIGQKLGKSLSDVDLEDIKTHGLLVIIRADEGEEPFHSAFKQHPGYENLKYYEEPPTSVEPYDFYSEEGASQVEILTGKKMIAFLRQNDALNVISGDSKRKLIKLLVQRHGPEKRSLIVDKVKALNDWDLERELEKEKRFLR